MAGTAAEDEYFPSFLTAAPSAPAGKAAAAPESPSRALRGVGAGGAAWPSRRKPRLTFAESLSMEKKSEADALLADSPFSLAAGADYLERLHVRRRKPRGAADDDSEYEEDAPPPPTVRLVW